MWMRRLRTGRLSIKNSLCAGQGVVGVHDGDNRAVLDLVCSADHPGMPTPLLVRIHFIIVMIRWNGLPPHPPPSANLYLCCSACLADCLPLICGAWARI